MVSACFDVLHFKTSKGKVCGDMKKKKKKMEKMEKMDKEDKKEDDKKDKKEKKCMSCSSCCFFICHRAQPASPTSAIHHVDPQTSKTLPNSSDCKQIESDKDSFLVPLDSETPLDAPSSSPKCAKKQTKGSAHGKHRQEKRLSNMNHEEKRPRRRTSLIRASSSNMIFGNVGNVKRKKKNSDITRDVLDYLPDAAEELRAEANANKKTAKESEIASQEELCMLDADGLKEKGNEEYTNGRYTEAVALYEAAISIDPNKASYWSNKAAALISLGRLLEAVSDCRTAVKIDPSYRRAHYRLGTLYLRLGDADGAVNHYMLARNEAIGDDMARAQVLQTHILMSNQARMIKDWPALLKMTQSAISAGADSAPQVFALQADALLNLHRPEEADAVLASTPRFDMDASTKVFGAVSTAYLHGVIAQVDIALGRFQDAVTSTEKAVQLDPDNVYLTSLAQKALDLTSDWLKGDDLFKAYKFNGACKAYGKGLDHDPCNAILLCNRAACHLKLDQCEKAIEDCNATLEILPSYSKARICRAESNSKLRRWDKSIEDYEVLLRQMPGDEGLVDALFEAHAQLKKQPGTGAKKSEHNPGLSHQ